MAFLGFKDFPLYLDPFPPTPPKEQKTDNTDGRFRDHNGEKHPFWPKTQPNRQQPGQRDLKGPKTEEIHDRRRPGITGAIKGVGHHHPYPIKDVARGDYLQGAHRNDANRGVRINKRYDISAQKQQDQSDQQRKYDIEG